MRHMRFAIRPALYEPGVRSPSEEKKERGGPEPSVSRSDLVAGSAAAAPQLLELALRLAVADEQEHARRDRDDGRQQEDQRSRRGRLSRELLEAARRDVDHNEALPARGARGDDDQARLLWRGEDALLVDRASRGLPIYRLSRHRVPELVRH